MQLHTAGEAKSAVMTALFRSPYDDTSMENSLRD